MKPETPVLVDDRAVANVKGFHVAAEIMSKPKTI